MIDSLSRTAASPAHGCKRAVAAILAFPMLIFGALDAKADGESDGPLVRVMTQNMDEGMDFVELSTATTPAQFIAAVTTTYNNILATKPAERAAAMPARL